MAPQKSTRERILEASLRLFNERGYSPTKISAIAEEVGIAEGNLWYHFRTKRDLVRALEERVRESIHIAREVPDTATPAEAWIERLGGVCTVGWRYRFLMRDYGQYRRDGEPLRRDPDLLTDFGVITEGIRRFEKEGMLRSGLDVDVDELARSIWFVARYWTDYLREIEGLDEIGAEHAARGIRQTCAILFPHLTAAARRQVQAALANWAARFEGEGAG